ncbi:MAG: ribonuclease P protein component [Candidatus Margulisiibacteriota bacterium]|nr:ribonuclease P protein component [Candidatus Margulisiibacteriota bacterium]
MISLNTDRDFRRVFDKGRRIAGKHVLVFATPNALSEIRVGIICSKKLSKKAVERNKIRRRIKAVLSRLELSGQGFDLIILPKFVWAKGKFDELASTLNNCLSRAGIC